MHARPPYNTSGADTIFMNCFSRFSCNRSQRYSTSWSLVMIITAAFSSNLMYEPSLRRVYIDWSYYNSLDLIAFLNCLPPGVASLVALIISPIWAYLLVEPPITRIVNNSTLLRCYRLPSILFPAESAGSPSYLIILPSQLSVQVSISYILWKRSCLLIFTVSPMLHSFFSSCALKTLSLLYNLAIKLDALHGLRLQQWLILSILSRFF